MRARTRTVQAARTAASILASFILITSAITVPAAGARTSAQVHAEAPDGPFNTELLSEFGGGTYTSIEASGGAWFAIRAGKLVVGRAVVPMADPVQTEVRGIDVYPWRDRVLVLRENGLAMVDCSDITSPTLMAEYSYCNEVTLTGFAAGPRYAYCSFAYRWGGTVCKVFDLTDTENTGYVAAISLESNDRHGDVRGNCLYVKTPTGFKVYGLASPLAPAAGGTYAGTEPVADVTVEGGHLYVAYGDPDAPSAGKGLRVYSLAAPTSPTLVRTQPTPEPLVDVSVEGTRAWTLDAANGVRLYDVTTPSAPATQSGSAVVATAGVQLAADGVELFVRSYDANDGTSRISGIDGTDPATFHVVSSRSANGGFGDPCIDGTVAYLPMSGGLAAYRIDDPANPMPAAGIALPGPPSDVEVSGGSGFVAYGDGTTCAVQRVSGLPDSGAAGAAWTTDTARIGRIDADGGLLVAGADTGMLVFDVSGPGITLADFLASDTPVTDVVVDGTRAWAVLDEAEAGWSLLYELDVTTPTAPVPIAEHGIPGDAATLAKTGGTLYVGWETDEQSAVKIFDVATTGELAYVTSSDTGWHGCAGTAASGGATPTAVAVGSGGLRLIDAASPALPFLAGFHPVGGTFATMANDLVLVTDPDEGARLYRYTQVTDRDAGLSRYETAVEMSKDIPASDYVVLATGATYPDALCGASLAYALDAPILLVQPSGIPDEVAARITELGATKAIVLGGTAAVGQGVIDDLAALGITGDNVTRLSGSDRYETAEQIALELESVLGAGSCDTAFIATGLNYPDALAAGGAAAKMGAPILLTKPWELPDATADALDALGCADTIVLGGTGAVPDAIAADLPSPERLAGATRYDTAVQIAGFSLTEPSCAFTPGELFVVTGLNFPDALPCGVISAMHDAPTLLVNAGVPGATGAFVADHAADVNSIRIVGGTGAVPADVEYELFALVQGR